MSHTGIPKNVLTSESKAKAATHEEKGIHPHASAQVHLHLSNNGNHIIFWTLVSQPKALLAATASHVPPSPGYKMNGHPLKAQENQCPAPAGLQLVNTPNGTRSSANDPVSCPFVSFVAMTLWVKPWPDWMDVLGGCACTKNSEGQAPVGAHQSEVSTAGIVCGSKRKWRGWYGYVLWVMTMEIFLGSWLGGCR